LLDETHVRFFTRENLDHFLQDAGFAAVDVRTTTAPLFGTELRLRREDYPAEVVAQLENDPDAQVYQFVLRAAPDDVTQVESAVAWKLLETQRRLAAAKAEVTRLHHELDVERERTAAALAARDETERAHRETEEQLLRTHATKTFRVTRLPRRLYGLLRG